MVVSWNHTARSIWRCFLTGLLFAWASGPRALGASTEEGKPVFEQLAQDDRAFVILTLLTLVLVAIVLTLVIIVGGRWARRRAEWRRGPTTFGGLAGVGPGLRSATDLPGIKEGDSISTSETLVDGGNEDTRQLEG